MMEEFLTANDYCLYEERLVHYYFVFEVVSEVRKTRGGQNLKLLMQSYVRFSIGISMDGPGKCAKTLSL
jgi:hypothetical protein